MFTDEPVTPRRVEILVDVVAEFGRPGPLRKDQLLELVQPETLPGLISKTEISRSPGESTLRAARELELVEEQDGAWVLSGVHREHRRQDTRDVILAALDARVLFSDDVEPYFTLFFSYLLGLGQSADSPIADDLRASAFNAALGFGADANNPFNDTKLRGLWRWFPYTGLGWFDSRDVFQCEPHGRLRRSLSRIFEQDSRLDSDSFMTRLSRVCPELDGGRLFRKANPQWEASGRVVSLGLAQALVALHEDGVIVLDCPRDSRGWDLSAAEPSNDGGKLRSDRLDAIEFVRVRARKRRSAGDAL